MQQLEILHMYIQDLWQVHSGIPEPVLQTPEHGVQPGSLCRCDDRQEDLSVLIPHAAMSEAVP